MNNLTESHFITEQGRLPVYFSEMLNICDPVLAFDRIMEEIKIWEYLKDSEKTTGRNGYNAVKMLKVILFAFMETGYASLREIEDRCKVNIRYKYLMDGETPTYKTFCNFINNNLKDNIEEIFNGVFQYIKEKDHVDLNHLYIDGSKFEANANKYTWVWKKATEKSRYRLYTKITTLLNEMNEVISYFGLKIETGTEYVPNQLEEIAENYAKAVNLDESTFVEGKGHRKTIYQRQYQLLKNYAEKLKEYCEKMDICGQNRNSYSKTDNSATFMRIKTDYMGNDQLLPAYNVQFGVADEYIAVVDVNHYRADMDCFIPLMEKFNKIYGFRPKYPVADAGYGSYNNYIYCEQNGMEKYMKFTMFKKEVKDEKYHNDPFRAVNFKTNDKGELICPNNKVFKFAYKKHVKGNNYGREEEVYTCEDCSGCPYAEKCKKTEKNRSIRLNQELTKYHQEVINNLESTHGMLLRMNRSIQSEGTFGIIKYDRWYNRTVRRGIISVNLEIMLVSIGFNLHKYYNKLMKSEDQAA